jgi:hypothetical protein
MPAQAVHCGFVRQARARAGLVKRGHQGLLCQHVAIPPAPGYRFQFLRYIEDVKKFVPLEFFQ